MYSPFSSLSAFVYFALVLYCLFDYNKRRPEFFWLWLILVFHPFGALGYFVIHVLPEFISGSGRSIFAQLNPKDRQEYRRLLSRFGEDSPLGHVEQLMLLSTKYGQPADTLRYAEIVLAREPQSLAARYAAGLASWRKRDLPSAETYLRQVVQADPKHDYGLAYLALAEVLAESGKKSEALAAFEQVVRQSSFLEGRYYYASLLHEAGRSAEARQVLEDLLRSAADTPQFRRREDRGWVRKARGLLRKVA